MKARLYCVREKRVDWRPDRLSWVVELVIHGETYRARGRLVPHRTARPLPYVAIRCEKLERYRREWGRWIELVPSRHATALDTAIHEVRVSVDARRAMEAA